MSAATADPINVVVPMRAYAIGAVGEEPREFLDVVGSWEGDNKVKFKTKNARGELVEQEGRMFFMGPRLSILYAHRDTPGMIFTEYVEQRSWTIVGILRDTYCRDEQCKMFTK